MMEVKSSRNKPKFNLIDGILLDETYIPEAFISATKFKPRRGDIVIATYPKCGTTWMCQIALLILRRGRPFENAEEYFKSCPYIDFEGAESVESMIKPGVIKTHLPFTKINFSDQAKYIYVTRHPRDCVVSAYHQTKYFPNYYFSDGTFDDFFDLFIRGEVDYNDYFDNLLSWYQHRNDPNVLFTTFEKMKADHRGVILEVAKFLGKEHHSALLENDGELLDQVQHYSSFEYMKKVTNQMFTDYYMNPPETGDEKAKHCYDSLQRAKREGHVSNGVFIRKGKVGEGKTVLSQEQERRLQERIVEKTNGSDVMSLWEE